MNLVEQRMLFEEVSSHLAQAMAEMVSYSLSQSDPAGSVFNLDDVASKLAERLYNSGWRSGGERPS